jgi:hypothetical protein
MRKTAAGGAEIEQTRERGPCRAGMHDSSPNGFGAGIFPALFPDSVRAPGVDLRGGRTDETILKSEPRPGKALTTSSANP